MCLLFYFKPAFTTFRPLFFYILLKISLSSFLINPGGIFTGIALISLTIIAWLDCCNGKVNGLSAFALTPLKGPSPAVFLKCKINHVISLLKTFHLHPNPKSLHTLHRPAAYLSDLIACCSLPCSLLPSHVVLLAVPQIFLAHSSLKAFALVYLSAWKALPSDTWIACSLSSFRFFDETSSQ